MKKKIKLPKLDLTEILSRDELKNIMRVDFRSGSGSGWPWGSWPFGSNSGSGWPWGSGSGHIIPTIPPKIGACLGKQYGAECYWTDADGITHGPGVCAAHFQPPLYCMT